MYAEDNSPRATSPRLLSASNTVHSALRDAIHRIECGDGIEAAFIVGRDGLLVSLGSPRSQADLQAAMAAAVFGAIDRAAASLDVGDARGALIETTKGAVQILSLGNHLLVAITSKQANLATVRALMGKAACDLARVLSTS